MNTKSLIIWFLGITLICPAFGNDNGSDVADENIYTHKELETPPKPIKMPMPIYPKKLRKQNIEGKVILEFVVNEKGRVEDIQVMESNHELFSEASIKAAKTWLFTPGKIGNDPKACKVRIPINLNIVKAEK